MAQTEINPDGQPAGRAGQLADNSPCEVTSGFNGEASAGMDFGLAVKRDVTDRSGRKYKVLSAQADIVSGITVWGFNHVGGTGGDLDASGLQKPGAPLDILKEGTILVVVEEAVAPEDRGYVRAIANAPNNTIGAFRKSADGSNTIDLTRNVRYITAAVAGGLAWAECDFTIKAG